MKTFVIIPTLKCPANCDFCGFRPLFKKIPKSYLPLIAGSLKENSFYEILKDKWKENPFLRMINGLSGPYFLTRIERDLIDKVKVIDPCELCYEHRKETNFKNKYDFSGDMSMRDFKNAIDDAEKLRFKEMVISGGGEPLIEYNKTLEIIRYANNKFRKVRLLTNAYVFDSLQKSLKIVKELKENGLSRIDVTTEFHPRYKFHQSFINLKKIRNLYLATKKNELALDIRVLITNDPYLIKLNLNRLNKYINLEEFELLSLNYSSLSFFYRLLKKKIFNTKTINFSFVGRNFISEKNMRFQDFPKEDFIFKNLRLEYLKFKDIILRPFGLSSLSCGFPSIFPNGIVTFCCTNLI